VLTGCGVFVRQDVPGKRFYMSKELFDFLSPDEKAGKGSGCCS
jgi:hypothetical protein